MYAPVRTKEMPANELNTYSYFKGPKPEPGRERPFHYSLQIKTTRSGSIRRQFSETKQAITSNPCPEATHMHEIDLLNTPPRSPLICLSFYNCIFLLFLCSISLSHSLSNHGSFTPLSLSLIFYFSIILSLSLKPHVPPFSFHINSIFLPHSITLTPLFLPLPHTLSIPVRERRETRG